MHSVKPVTMHPITFILSASSNCTSCAILKVTDCRKRTVKLQFYSNAPYLKITPWRVRPFIYIIRFSKQLSLISDHWSPISNCSIDKQIICRPIIYATTIANIYIKAELFSVYTIWNDWNLQNTSYRSRYQILNQAADRELTWIFPFIICINVGISRFSVHHKSQYKIS